MRVLFCSVLFQVNFSLTTFFKPYSYSFGKKQPIMDINSLQYVVGEAKTGEPAVIRFFGRVSEENTARFNEEFDFLENVGVT